MNSASSFYVGPGRPRLPLPAWRDVEIAASAGLLEESAWIECKEAVPTGKPANRELARDLASLSVDGGLLLIGVADKTYEVVGCTEDPDALKTRVIQVAGAAITPPLFVDIDVLPGTPTVTAVAEPGVPEPDVGESGVSAPSADETRSILVVRVPASGSAPHMVDGVYWGRSAEGKRSLADPLVERLMSERRGRVTSMADDLHYLESDLGRMGGSVAAHSHLAFYARPRGAASVTMTDALREAWAPQLLNDARDFQASWSPWNGLSANKSFRPDGILLSSDEPRYGQVADEQSAYRILLRDDGAVLAVAGGVSHEMTSQRIKGEFEVIVCGYLLEGVHTLTRLAGYLASEHLAYWAEWEVGVLVTDLRGRWSTDRFSRGDLDLHDFPVPEFIGQTVCSTREMLEAPAGIVGRLMTPMLRSLGVDRFWLPYERGEQIRERRGR